MGETPADTVKEIDETRRRLDRELDELESRLPGRTVIRRALRLAYGGGLGGAIFWIVARRLWQSRSTPALPQQAVPPVEVHLLPDRWVDALETREARMLALFAAGTWIGFRLMERRRVAAR